MLYLVDSLYWWPIEQKVVNPPIKRCHTVLAWVVVLRGRDLPPSPQAPLARGEGGARAIWCKRSLPLARGGEDHPANDNIRSQTSITEPSKVAIDSDARLDVG